MKIIRRRPEEKDNSQGTVKFRKRSTVGGQRSAEKVG